MDKEKRQQGEWRLGEIRTANSEKVIKAILIIFMEFLSSIHLMFGINNYGPLNPQP